MAFCYLKPESEAPGSKQADAVLSMTLRRLTALEIGKVEEEGRDLRERIARLKGLLGSDQAIRETVAHEAREVADSMGNPRRSVVSYAPPPPPPACTPLYHPLYLPQNDTGCISQNCMLQLLLGLGPAKGLHKRN